jgi:hypothetical protein
MMNAALDDTRAAERPANPSNGRLALPLRAARCALQWRLLVLWTGVLLLPALVAALPVWQLLSANLDHTVHAAALASRLDLVALADLSGALARSGAATGNGTLLSLVLTLLLSPLLSGMTIAAARAPQQLGFSGLVAGGVLEYARLLRMMVWALVPLGLAAALSGVAMSAADKAGERAILEADASHASLAAIVFAAVVLLLANATLDAGRATLAIDRRRKSAVRAWWDGCKLLGRRPLATFGAWFGISALGLALAALLGVARIKVPALGAGGFLAAFALTQLAVAAVAWMRSARLVALMELARAGARKSAAAGAAGFGAIG